MWKNTWHWEQREGGKLANHGRLGMETPAEQALQSFPGNLVQAGSFGRNYARSLEMGSGIGGVGEGGERKRMGEALAKFKTVLTHTLPRLQTEFVCFVLCAR